MRERALLHGRHLRRLRRLHRPGRNVRDEHHRYPLGKLVGAANDIDVGPDGSVWVIGTGAVPGGFGIFRWTGSTWENVPGGAARIAVGPGGVPWVTNSNGNIFRRTGNDWQVMPGAAHDVDIGPEGSVWVIGTDRQPPAASASTSSPAPPGRRWRAPPSASPSDRKASPGW